MFQCFHLIKMVACIICLESFADNEKPTTLTQKGCNGISKASVDFGKTIFPVPGDKVHERCRKKHTNGISVSELSSIASEAEATNRNEVFTFENCCLFCGENIKCKTVDGSVYHVKSTSFRETISRIILARNDEWAKEVSSRIELEPNLHEVQATYHQQCNVNFRTHRNKPNAGVSAQKGAPINAHLNESFLQLVAFMENSDEPYTTVDLSKKLQEYSGGDTYSVRYLKEKLIKQFDDRILFIGRDGLSDIVIMKEASERIIIKSYEEKSSQCDRMETSAKYVLSEIKSMSNNKDVYPSPEEIASIECGLSFIPQTLKTFLSVLFGQQKTDQTAKIISIGHAIVQACCPRRLLSPIQLGLGVQISVLTSSRFLIDTLHSLGFCCSYAEVRKFRYCATIFNDQIESEQLFTHSTVTKYAADNVDHNVCTLDGKGTFHGMGMISIESALGNGHEKKIPRINATIDDVKKVNGVEIVHYAEGEEDSDCIKYSKLSPTVIHDAFHKLDLLWTLSWPIIPDRPAWSGFMQMIATGRYLPKPTITFLPMIDLSSTNSTCLYSTMLFIAREALKKGTTPVLTFDQLLHWKARIIIEKESVSSPLKKIVLMLGGFHMKMSYLGCIGYLMAGSGLQEVLEQTYAPNTVTKMLSGKAIARSIRGHLLVYAALSAIISEKTFSENEKSKLASLYLGTVKKEIQFNELENDPDLLAMDVKLSDSKKQLQLTGPTSRLWLQYIRMIDIFKSNMRGDRTGDFQLHLQSTQAMLPYYPASGHNNYTKSIYVYLQDMERLKETNPDVYTFFDEGNFVTRRSNRYWSGLPDDLVIEQVLMRSLKSAGGLTRGTGFGEVQRTIWLKSMPTCAAVNDAMQHFTHKALETSEQHKEIGLTRQKRDIRDTKIVYDYLNERNIFENLPGLRNIVDGTVSNANSNPYLAESVGSAIIKKLENNGSSDYVFKKKDQVIVMNNKNTIQIDDDNVQIDPEVLFQRLIFIQNNRNNEDVERILHYELTQRPPVFFDENGFLRDGNDSAISDTLWKKFGSNMSSECEKVDECVYVLSGDWVLNEVCWQKGETFNEICKRYIEFILRKYGKSTTIIFKESEMNPSILDEKFIRNKKGICGAEVSFTDNTPLKTKKQEFLNNDKNRNGFVKMLSEKLVKEGCTAYATLGDVNVLIAQTSACMSRKKMVVVIGDEANLLPLMCFYVRASNCGLYLRCLKKIKSKQSTRLWNITETQNLMGIDKSKYLLFVHAFGGCQSTSHIFGVGEGILYSKLDDKHFVAQAKVFCNQFATHKEIIDAGEQAMVLLFKGKASQKLNKLRFEKYKEKVATETSTVFAKRLPPTEAATSYHSLRTFYQIQVWMQQNDELNPLDYGWKQGVNRLVPILSSLPPAPPSLLSAIRCGCKAYCDTRRCSCKAIGLRCTTACKHCDHERCKNYEIYEQEEEEDDDDIDYLFFDF